MQRLEHGDRVAELPELRRHRQRRGPGAHAGHLLAGVGGAGGGLDQAVLAGVVGGEALQAPDGDRAELVLQDAGVLAVGLLRADAAADGGEKGGLEDLGGGGAEVFLIDQVHELGDLDVDRAGELAGLVLAAEAAGGLGDGLFQAEAERDLVEIGAACHRVLVAPMVLLDRRSRLLGLVFHASIIQNHRADAVRPGPPTVWFRATLGKGGSTAMRLRGTALGYARAASSAMRDRRPTVPCSQERGARPWEALHFSVTGAAPGGAGGGGKMLYFSGSPFPDLQSHPLRR